MQNSLSWHAWASWGSRIGEVIEATDIHEWKLRCTVLALLTLLPALTSSSASTIDQGFTTETSAVPVAFKGPVTVSQENVHPRKFGILS